MTGFPLHLAQVLEEEFVVLHEPTERTEGDWLFQPDHIDADKLKAALLEPSLTARSLHEQHFPDPVMLTSLELVNAINDFLMRPRLLFGHKVLRELPLSTWLRELVRLRPAGDSLVHVNRLLVEAAFSDAILKKVRDVRLQGVYARIHKRANAGGALRTALCLSGGGIRSATFGLGIIQGLARLNLLDKFDYLSTVSGGGYIGAWLSAWIHRHRDSTPGVMRDLTAQPPSPVEPEPKPVHRLREYSNYLSPRLGLLSADTWTLAATYLRNLLLIWLVLIPILLGVLAVPRLLLSLMTWAPPPGRGVQTVVLIAGLASMVVSITYVGIFRPSREERRRRRLRLGVQGLAKESGFVWCCLAPFVLASILITTFWAWAISKPSDVSAWTFAAVGAGVYAASWLAYTAILWRWADARRVPQEFVTVIVTGAVTGLIVWLLATRLLPNVAAREFAEYYVWFAVPLVLAGFTLAVTLFVGVASLWTSDEDREWLARLAAWLLIASATWSVVTPLVILGPVVFLNSIPRAVASLSIGGVAGTVALLLGGSSKTPAAGRTANGNWVTWLMDGLGTVVAPVAVALVVVLLSLLTTTMSSSVLRALPTTVLNAVMTCEPGAAVSSPLPLPADRFGHFTLLRCLRPHLVTLWVALAFGLGILMSYVIDVNRFSLNAMYRNRLIRAYLGASRGRRQPNPFTGFDPLDDIQMHELRDEAFNSGSFRDLRRFVERLKLAADPVTPAADPVKPAADRVSAALVRRFVPETQAMLQAHDPQVAPSATLQRQLIEDLNAVLDDDDEKSDIRGDAAFRVEAAAVARERAAKHWTPSQHRRALLDAAYSKEIRRRPPPPRKPLHVVNIALNLVRGKKLAWQERKAESFTVTELHSGSYHLGYRRSKDYASTTSRGISLGSAVTISGAAASPNMGYHSSPMVSLLMTLFNVRLGWWLGNPGPAGQRTCSKSTGTPVFGGLVSEALGLTDDTGKYVYLSDGGHFDNLGVLEMVLRRCHLIVVCDASSDPGFAFDDLGNVIRKVRIDLGVPIRIEGTMKLFPRQDTDGQNGRTGGTYCAVATIQYTAVDGRDARDGHLVYVKPAFYRSGAAPTDIYNYAQTHPTFPHETTVDQFFSESQFESYRALGVYAAETVWGSGLEESVVKLLDRSRQHAGITVSDPPLRARSLLARLLHSITQ